MNATTRLYRRAETRVDVDGPRWKEGYIFAGYEAGNDLVQEMVNFAIHARSKLTEIGTLELVVTLERKFRQGQYERLSWSDFLQQVEFPIGMDGALTVPWCGMLLLVERDGYCHT